MALFVFFSNRWCYCCRVVPKNSFKHNHIYVLNNIMQMLQVSGKSSIKYNIIQVNIFILYLIMLFLLTSNICVVLFNTYVIVF